MENFHIIKVKYLGATEKRGSRVKIESERFKQSILTDYDYEFTNTYEIAENWLKASSFEIVGKAEGKDCYYIISSTFKPLK